MDRPLGITILAVLGFIGAIAFFAIAALFAALSPIFMSELKSATPFMSILFTAGSILFVIIGAVQLVISYGLWKGAGWAWWIYVILLAIGIVSSLLSLPQGVLGIAINGVVLYYMTRPHVKEYFGV